MGEAMSTEITKIGKCGTFVIPASLRKKYGLTDGSLVVAEEQDGGILIRPAVAFPIEIYSSERIAEFLLSNAIDTEDYESAVEEVRAMELNPDEIPHVTPPKMS